METNPFTIDLKYKVIIQVPRSHFNKLSTSGGSNAAHPEPVEG